MIILESLGQIEQGSLDTWIFVTVRYSSPTDPISREATFGLIEPTGDGIVKYRKKLRNDTIRKYDEQHIGSNYNRAHSPNSPGNVCRTPKTKKIQK